MATLTISSKNYSSWSLRGWLLVRLSGIAFDEVSVLPDDPDSRAETLLLSSSIRVPRLQYDGVECWHTLSIAEFLNELCPQARLLPDERAARAHCRSICGEMHSGFIALRSALPMNIRAHFKNFKIWSRAQTDIDRITSIWRECLSLYGGPFLFGERPTIADAIYAPVVLRFRTYDVDIDAVCAAYCQQVLALPALQEWIAAAQCEPDDIDELEAEF